MLTKENETKLLEEAIEEEKANNWAEAGRFYEEVVEIYLDKKIIDKAAEVYKKLGYSNTRAADIADTADEYLKHNKNAIDAYKNASNLFKQINKKPKELECEAESFFISGFVKKTANDAYKAFEKSRELFSQASDLFSKKNEQEAANKILVRELSAIAYQMSSCSDGKLIERLDNEMFDIFPLDLDCLAFNIQTIAEIYFIRCFGIYFAAHIENFKGVDKFKKRMQGILSILDDLEHLKLIENCQDPRILGMLYFAIGQHYCAFGFEFIEDELEQREYIEKGLENLKKGLEFARDSREKKIIIYTMYFIYWWAVSVYKFEYLKIVEDFNELAKYREIYSGFFSVWRFLTNFLPMFYYAASAMAKLLSIRQRLSNAKKALVHANECLSSSEFLPFSTLVYWMLTLSHSILSQYANDKNGRNEHTIKMLEYVKQAEALAINYEGGFIVSTSHGTRYLAYKTLADKAETNEEKIKLLTIATTAAEKYAEHPADVLSGRIEAKMRIGLLYEKIGVLSTKNDILTKAENIFLNVIDECNKRGYLSNAAATSTYIARIEDRLGNYTQSAIYYEKAQNAYTASLKKIENKRLKGRVKEKMNYANVWSLIESAKDSHKKENHIKAKEFYKNASDILKNLPSYSHESLYYLAWASLEEAELLSKQEKHENAKKNYEMTIIAFNNALKSMKDVSKRLKNKFALERIETLSKMAKLRIKYCSARFNVEKARILGKQGEHCAAAELFASAAAEFRYVCNLYKIERERGELTAVYFLCRAWETMELAEKYENPERFSEASNLFLKASNIFLDSKLKLLAEGNSAFCQALKLGCKFDETNESESKGKIYPKIRAILRKAASSYKKGGFKNGGNWALATSIYFDAAWSLILADEELEFEKRNELLKVGSDYLKSAAELFKKAGYKDKEIEVINKLSMVEKEEKIIFSALNSITKPDISSSTIGIIAPACPLETSQSPRIGEVREITEEERRVSRERKVKQKYEIVYKDLSQEYPRVQKSNCRVGIAQIGVSKSNNVIGELFQMKPSGLLGIKEDKIESIKAQVRNIVENANKEGVNLLLFPEMVIDLNYGDVLEEISDLAKFYDIYIIPGSFHNQETKRNVSLVFSPDGILWEQEKHIPATIHFGKKRFREAIEIGNLPRKTIVSNTEYGRIAIAICRDFLDMDLRVELKNSEPPVDIILNPAFTPVTADFKAAHFDARRSIYAYCFFANFAEFGDSFIHTPEKDRTKRTIPPKEEGLIYKDVDLFRLRSERKKWEEKQKKEKGFIQSTR